MRGYENLSLPEVSPPLLFLKGRSDHLTGKGRTKIMLIDFYPEFIFDITNSGLELCS